MKWLFLLSAWFFSILCHAQGYRLSYDEYSIPELYNSVQVVVEETGADNRCQPVTGKYTLQSTEAKFIGNRIEVDRKTLHQNKGIINCTLTYKGKTHLLPLKLPVLTGIRFNPYADSIKPVLNYYLNVEGVFSSGKVYPLNIAHVDIRASKGSVQGMEWVKPAVIDFDKVTFTAVCTYDAVIATQVTVYIKKSGLE